MGYRAHSHEHQPRLSILALAYPQPYHISQSRTILATFVS